MLIVAVHCLRLSPLVSAFGTDAEADAWLSAARLFVASEAPAGCLQPGCFGR